MEPVKSIFGLPKTHILDGAHPHPWSRACRSAAQRVLISRAITCAQHAAGRDLLPTDEVRILSIYGSDSEHRLVDKLNAAMAGRGPTIKMTTYCPYTFEGDAVRQYNLAIRDEQVFSALASGKFHGVHLIDIYQCGDTSSRALDLEYMLDISKFSLNEEVSVVLRLFYGQAGADIMPRLPPVDGKPAKPLEVEGVWYRNESNLIVFSPESDNNCSPYPPHPDCNWLASGRHISKEIVAGKRLGGLDAAISRQYGPYTHIVVKPSAPNAIHVQPSLHEVVGAFTWWTPETVSLQNRILAGCIGDVMRKFDALTGASVMSDDMRRALLCCDKVLVCTETVADLYGENFNVVSGYSLNTIRFNVRERLKCNSAYLAIQRGCPPAVSQAIFQGTVIAALFNGRKAFAERLLAGRVDDFAAQAAFTAAHGTNPGKSPRILVSALKTIAIVSGLGLLAWHFNPEHAVNRVRDLRAGLEHAARTIGIRRSEITDTVRQNADMAREAAVRVGRAVGMLHPEYSDAARRIVSISRDATMFSVQEPERDVLSGFCTWFTTRDVLFNGDDVPQHVDATPLRVNATACANPCRKYFASALKTIFALSGGGVVTHAVWSYMDNKPSVQDMPRAVFENYNTLMRGGGDFIVHPRRFLQTVIDEGMRGIIHLETGATLSTTNVSREALRNAHAGCRAPGSCPSLLEIIVDRRSLSFEEYVPIVECEPRGSYYPIIGLANGLGVPAGTASNALYALLKRSLPNNVIKLHADKPQIMRIAEASGAAIRSLVRPTMPSAYPSREECFANLPPRSRDRMIRTVSSMEAGQSRPRAGFGKETILKTGETVKVDGDGINVRLLDNCDPEHNVTSTQAAHSALSALKKTFGWERDYGLLKCGAWNVRLFICSGRTPAEMDEFATLLGCSEPLILIAGDDCAIYWNGHATRWNVAATETDAAKFDVTQSMPVLQEAAKTFMHANSECAEALGMLACLQFLALAEEPMKWTCRKTGTRIKTHPETRAPTGTSFTTVMNNHALILFLYYHFSTLLPPSQVGIELLDFAKTAAHLGFDFTVEHHSQVEQAIFLKGAFLRSETTGAHSFSVLPSRVLKLGKSIRDPCLSQGLKKKDAAEAVRRAAASLGRSMPLVPDDYPVLGEFLCTLRRLGSANGRAQHSEQDDNPYRVEHNNDVSREVVLRFVCARYNTTVAEIEDLEDLFRDIKSLPAFAVHPLIAKMAIRDYF